MIATRSRLHATCPKTLERNESGVNLGSKGIGQRKNDRHVDNDGNQRNPDIGGSRHPVGTNNNMGRESQAGQEAGQKKRPIPMLVKPGLEIARSICCDAEREMRRADCCPANGVLPKNQQNRHKKHQGRAA